ncbi:Tannase [Pestalotiopsis fici W106-1]|uniref:Carboxylic ester hydrolase n=1 Tax=Pestalotiopsis fici (strain W106-1 / CGMCC3.15140) TaxID=1229662 RepID=W3WHT9_PESFW|nr:Tannase [Pestalotiopsis fici W106-1]ETS73339.1 Tannase [Pestalotiopsis fici W106-1]
MTGRVFPYPLADVCTVTNVQAALPANGTFLGIDLIPTSVTAAVTNSTGSSGPGSASSSSAIYTYCNVTVAYTHTGKGDKVVVTYAFPSPSDFLGRFYVPGGEAWSLSTDPTGGLEYGAVGGVSDGGYDNANSAYDTVFLYGNGSINWDATYMFSYQALGEMTQVGQAVTPGFYGASADAKLYTYFEGCSDGGRQGMSQVQRWGELYDGVVAGAPAFRAAQQQVLHMWSAVVEHTMDYYPPSCELDKIVNATIAACDPLDGRTDGVISRTDLCKLNFNLTDLIGEPYYCAAENSTSLGYGFNKRQAAGSEAVTTPAQNGTISAEGVQLAQSIYDGVFNSKGQRAYLSWQIGSELEDAAATYDSDTGAWELDIVQTGGEFVSRWIELLDADNIYSLDNVTYDTVVEWMKVAFVKYYDSLQTTEPDLSNFQSSGGKLLHYHGESDPSVPAASSVHYWQSVRSVMYPDASDEESLETLQDWYQFYLIPGAAHCGTNDLQPGPWPVSNMGVIIDWVENGITPTKLNATVSSGDFEGETQLLCQWPTRPLWQGNSSNFDCVNDTTSYDSWTYDFPAFSTPVY